MNYSNYVIASKKAAGSIINKIGKYFKQNLDGAYKIAFHPMECEVFLRMFYEDPEDRTTFDEMHFIISIVSYQNKIRLNITEETAQEKTIGQLIVSIEEATDLSYLKYKFMETLRKSISKEYEGFDFIY